MKSLRFRLLIVVGIAGVWGVASSLNADPPAKDAKADSAPEKVPPAVARDRAKLLHETFAETLDVIHHHYFRREGSVLPARALDDVFARMERRTNAKVRWISVNTEAMNVDHNPKTDFEKKAAAALEAGKEEFSRVEDGYFYRAGPIPLGAGCVRCHTRFAQVEVRKPLLAGLVVGIPVKDDR